MKSFLAFVRKEFYHILRDRRTLLILFGMPIVQIIIFGYAISMEFRNASIAIVAHSKDALSLELTEKVMASGHFQLKKNLSSYQEIENEFQRGTVKLVMVIPPDFYNRFYSTGDAQVQVIADASDPNTAALLVNYAMVMINSFQLEHLGSRSIPYLIQVETRMLYNPQLRSVFLFVPGVMTLILMLVSAMMTSLTIAREKELGTMELLLVSPLPPILIIVGKVVPYVLLSFINAMLILLLGIYLFGMPVTGSIVLLLLLCTLFILTSLSLGILISTRTQTQQAAMLGSLMGLMMPTMILSGFIFPLESMPKVLQGISNFIPAKWFIIILRSVMLKGVGLSFIWKETLILLGMMLFFLLVSWRNFKIRLS